jgi:hypothetical protein
MSSEQGPRTAGMEASANDFVSRHLTLQITLTSKEAKA